MGVLESFKVIARLIFGSFLLSSWGPFWALFRPYWCHFAGAFGAFWYRLGVILAHFRMFLHTFGSYWGGIAVISGHFGGIFGIIFLGILAVCLDRLGVILGIS